MNQEIFLFTIYMIHACAERWHVSPARVYRELKKSGCLEDYLVPHYEILHTQSTDYIVDDITEYLQKHGGQNDCLSWL